MNHNHLRKYKINFFLYFIKLNFFLLNNYFQLIVCPLSSYSVCCSSMPHSYLPPLHQENNPVVVFRSETIVMKLFVSYSFFIQNPNWHYFNTSLRCSLSYCVRNVSIRYIRLHYNAIYLSIVIKQLPADIKSWALDYNDCDTSRDFKSVLATIQFVVITRHSFLSCMICELHMS